MALVKGGKIDVSAELNLTATQPISLSGDDIRVTGLSNIGTANYIPGVNSGATAWEYKQLVQGSGITITHAAESITIAASVISHNLLSATHSDTVAASPVLGDLLYSDSTPKWIKLSGNITVTKKFLSQTGTGLISAAPVWDTLVAGDIPQLAHNSLSGLTSGDDHTQYALLAGRSGGQTLIGGTGSGDDLILQTTSHVTKGTYFLSDLTSNGFVKTSGSNGALSVDTSTYLTAEADTLATVTGRGATTATASTFSTSITSPLIIGGTTTTSDLTLQTTSGAGTTGADMHFLVGNNGDTEAMTILNNAYVGFSVSPTAPIHLAKTYTDTGALNIFQIVPTFSANTITSTQRIGRFDGTWSGTTSMVDFRGNDVVIRNTAAGTLTAATGQLGQIINSSTGTITTANGYDLTLANNKVGGGGTFTTANGAIITLNNTGTVGTYSGLNIADITNSGTITTTYGVYVGDITAGTQTNTPFSFYASDASAYNYFAGYVGVGGTPEQVLDVRSTSSNQLNLVDSNTFSTGVERTVDIDFRTKNPSGATTSGSAAIKSILTAWTGVTTPRGEIAFFTANATSGGSGDGISEKVRITGDGYFGAGIATPSDRVHSYDSRTTTGASCFYGQKVGNNVGTAYSYYGSIGGLSVTNIAGYFYATDAQTNYGIYCEVAAGSSSPPSTALYAGVFLGGNVGINETLPDYKLDVNGTFGFTPGSSVTPIDNGDVVIEATNNTTLTFKLKGDDGVVRSGTITLA